MKDYIAHYGIKRKSGRYPWGSGERPYQSEEEKRKVARLEKKIPKLEAKRDKYQEKLSRIKYKGAGKRSEKKLEASKRWEKQYDDYSKKLKDINYDRSNENYQTYRNLQTAGANWRAYYKNKAEKLDRARNKKYYKVKDKFDEYQKELEDTYRELKYEKSKDEVVKYKGYEFLRREISAVEFTPAGYKNKKQAREDIIWENKKNGTSEEYLQRELALLDYIYKDPNRYRYKGD